MMRQSITLGLAIAMATVLGTTASIGLAQNGLGQAIRVSQDAVEDTARHQEQVNELDEETQRLFNEYRANLKQLEQLKRYNASQRRQVAAQETEMESLRQDIDNISSLQRNVQPLMEDMVEGLEQLVEADIPYLPRERRDRIKRLRKIMNDADSSAAERYRLLIEAYQIENEYGRTIETYRGDITVGDTTYEDVQFVRIGRLELYFRTDDGSVLKRFDPQSRTWVELDQSFLPHIRTARRMAAEQIPPDLLKVPLRAPQSADASSSADK